MYLMMKQSSSDNMNQAKQYQLISLDVAIVRYLIAAFAEALTQPMDRVQYLLYMFQSFLFCYLLNRHTTLLCTMLL